MRYLIFFGTKSLRQPVGSSSQLGSRSLYKRHWQTVPGHWVGTVPWLCDFNSQSRKQFLACPVLKQPVHRIASLCQHGICKILILCCEAPHGSCINHVWVLLDQNFGFRFGHDCMFPSAALSLAIRGGGSTRVREGREASPRLPQPAFLCILRIKKSTPQFQTTAVPPLYLWGIYPKIPQRISKATDRIKPCTYYVLPYAYITCDKVYN